MATNVRFPFRRVCVFGASRSGVAAMRLLRHYGIGVTLIDEKPPDNSEALSDELHRMRVSSRFGQATSEALEDCQAVVVSRDVPPDHPVLDDARALGLPVLPEIELAAYFTSVPIVAVTGSKEKSNTAACIRHIVSRSTCRSVCPDSVEGALSEAVLRLQQGSRVEVLVTKVTSSELRSVTHFRPRIAVILGLAPEEVSHSSKSPECEEAMTRITLNQRSDDWLILNHDDREHTKAARRSHAEVYTFSTCGDVIEQGAFMDHGAIYLKEDREVIPLCLISETLLPGTRRVEALLAAIIAARRLGIERDALVDALRCFRGLEHRTEFVTRTEENVRYFNDSWASDVNSLKRAVQSFDRHLVLIAWKRGMAALSEQSAALVRSWIRGLVLIDDSGSSIDHRWRTSLPTANARDLYEAVRHATRMARPGDTVLLAPGCDTSNWYKNYEDRGCAFKDAVRRRLWGLSTPPELDVPVMRTFVRDRSEGDSTALTHAEEILLRKKVAEPVNAGAGPRAVRRQAVIALALFTGATFEQLSRLVVGMVELEGLDRALYVPADYGCIRQQLSEEIAELLLRYFKWKDEHGEDTSDPNAPLVCSQKGGGALGASGWGEAWKSGLRLIRVEGARSSRLTVGYRMAQEGIGPEELQRWLGYRTEESIHRFFVPRGSRPRDRSQNGSDRTQKLGQMNVNRP